MGLPSKKQLHKHKRGTRKALDTLDAMEKSNDESQIDEEVEAIIEKKKKEVEKEQPVSETKEEAVEEIVIEEIPEEEKPIELPPAESTQEISMELPEEQSAPKPEADASVQEGSDIQPPDKESTESSIQTLDIEPILTPDVTESNSKLGDEQAKPTEGEKSFMDDSKNAADTVNKASDQSPEQKQSQQPPEDSQEQLEYDDEGALLEDTQKDKYLTFNIGEEIYGISIVYVTEIIVVQRITEVPDTPIFVKGVINLRGKVIPVIDIRQRFKLELREYDERTCIIVVDCQETSIGVIVDIVAEVVDIPENQVDPPPKSHSGIQSSYILGMGKSGKQVTIILDIEKVLFVEELKRRQRELHE